MGRHVWPGLAAYRVNDGTSSAFSSSEIPNQITATRSRAGGTGHLLYNTTWTLKKSGGATAASLAPLYASPALVPAFPWLDAVAPPAPILTVSGNAVQITPGAGETARWWAVRAHLSGGWITRVIFGTSRSLLLASAPDRVVLNAVDQVGNLSADVTWTKP
jgi:hypothetical protein